MSKYSGPEYNSIKAWISRQIESEHTWEEIEHLCVSHEEGKTRFIELKKDEMLIPPDMDYSEWIPFVQEYQTTFKRVEYLYGISDLSSKTNSFEVPTKTGSAWVGYKNYLLGTSTGKPKMSDDAVIMLQNNCHWILNHLELDTRSGGPVKGLVMGSVQSGKTSNMIGLVTMAADYNWNIFIVLSGTIEGLRIQTRNRFTNDLKYAGGKDWHILDCRTGSDYMTDVISDKKISPLDLHLNGMQNGHQLNDFMERYVFVCLKNTSRLKKLITWLHLKSERAAKMRILLIDDEADQASINTKKIGEPEDEDEIKRTIVNDRIINLVKGYDSDGGETFSQFQAMNYVSYTATPYANVLNEAYRDSLYPSNFICTLPESDEYFGLKVIWGSKEDSENYPGLNVIRTIPDKEVNIYKTNPKNFFSEMFELKNSVAWFLCAAAVLRYNGYKKPVSMLINTTVLQSGHFDLYTVLKKYFEAEKTTGEILTNCRDIYNEELREFRLVNLIEGFHDYGKLSSVNDDFPDFDNIKDDILEMINCVTNVDLDSDGHPKWHENGIHLCVDNCAANSAFRRGVHLRIVYPEDADLAKMKSAPVFIVLGGNTLSRGLTLEGLVCTYFSRDSQQADSLMQMARFFGYRPGYELLQRIWMPKSVQDKFELMEEIDEKLKSEFVEFMRKGISPAKFGPRIMSSSVIARFLLTSRNKSQGMVPYDVDFTGTSYEVTKFENVKTDLEVNINVTEKFLTGIGTPCLSEVDGSSYIWYDVDSDYVISEFLDNYKIFNCCSLHIDIPLFKKWITEMNKEGRFSKWNVAIAGDKKSDSRWSVAGVDVGKIERSKKKDSRCIDIGSLRSGVDVLCDVCVSQLTKGKKDLFDKTRATKKFLIGTRYDIGLGDKPLLLLYRIDKNKGESKAKRIPIGSDCDIVGFSIIVAGQNPDSNHIRSVQVEIPNQD